MVTFWNIVKFIIFATCCCGNPFIHHDMRLRKSSYFHFRKNMMQEKFNNIWNTHFYSRVRKPSVVELLMIPDNCFREHSNQSTTSWCSMMDLLISTAVSFFKNKLGLVFRFMVAGYPFYCVRAGRVIVCSIFLNNLGGKRHINTIFTGPDQFPYT